MNERENVVPDWTLTPEIRKGDHQPIVQLLCGAHGCVNEGFALDTREAKRLGWAYDKRGGYGWICPDCAQ